MPPRHLTNLLISLLFLALISPPPPCAAVEEKIHRLEQNVADQQTKIKRVQERINDHRDLVKSSRRKELTLLSQLDEIDTALKNGQKRLTALKGNITEQEARIDAKNLELNQLIHEKQIAKGHVKKRLTAFYRMGKIGFMNVTFSTGTLPDLLNFKEYFRALIIYDQQVINDYRKKIEALTLAREELQREKGILLDVMVEVKNQENELAAFRKERVALLARVNTEKKLYQRAIEEMQNASVKLTEKLAMFRGQLRAEKSRSQRIYSSPKKRRPGTSSGFASRKGRLIPPVRGTVTTFFGKNIRGRFGLTTYANGIDIKTIPGSEVSAVFDGKVVYSGHLRGYGNLMIIDHKQQYYTLVSRLAELYKQKGDRVKVGEVIGIMHEQGGLLGEGLHFEIRHGTEPQDPLTWLNQSLLTIRE